MRQFDKLLLVRTKAELGELNLSAIDLPASTVFFEVIRDPVTHKPGLGKPLAYSETEKLAEFFASEKELPGRTRYAILFEREIAFSDSYDYWPTGRLRTRTMMKKDHPPSITHYSKSGRALTALIVEA